MYNKELNDQITEFGSKTLNDFLLKNKDFLTSTTKKTKHQKWHEIWFMYDQNIHFPSKNDNLNWRFRLSILKKENPNLLSDLGLID